VHECQASHPRISGSNSTAPSAGGTCTRVECPRQRQALDGLDEVGRRTRREHRLEQGISDAGVSAGGGGGGCGVVEERPGAEVELRPG
jgi:hypothetical protein